MGWVGGFYFRFHVTCDSTYQYTSGFTVAEKEQNGMCHPSSGINTFPEPIG